MGIHEHAGDRLRLSSHEPRARRDRQTGSCNRAQRAGAGAEPVCREIRAGRSHCSPSQPGKGPEWPRSVSGIELRRCYPRQLIIFFWALMLVAQLDFADPDFPVSLVEKPEPVLPGPEWARVHVTGGGICGSDLHAMFPDDTGSATLACFVSFPFEMGHEIGGVIVEAGAACGVPHAWHESRLHRRPRLRMV